MAMRAIKWSSCFWSALRNPPTRIGARERSGKSRALGSPQPERANPRHETRGTHMYVDMVEAMAASAAMAVTEASAEAMAASMEATAASAAAAIAASVVAAIVASVAATARLPPATPQAEYLAIRKRGRPRIPLETWAHTARMPGTPRWHPARPRVRIATWF